MEGLLIAEVLAAVKPLPAERLSWRFPDAYTFILPLGKKALWLFNRPPNPRIAFEEAYPPFSSSHSGFQDLLVAKAAGRLERIEQLKLDRVVKLYFGAGEGFVPTPEVILVAELTGRNCNLMLLDKAGKILGAARDISEEQNRFRQIRAGLPYQEPPAYEKLDPRQMNLQDLHDVLETKTLKHLRSVIDGIGPRLSEALAIRAGLSPDKALSKQDCALLYELIQRLLQEPSALMREALELPTVEALRKREERQSTLERLKQQLSKEEKLLERQLEDIEKARASASEIKLLRQQADLLMAYQYQIPKQASEAELMDFEGKTLTIKLDPKRSASAYAEDLYARIKKRQARAEQAESRQEELSKQRLALQALLTQLASLDDKSLEELAASHLAKEKKQKKLEPGIRYQGPLGYTILVGRNAKENDVVSFKLARSRDIWLHVQGYTGSHVIIQADNKDVPFEVILFAAQLAAAYSRAGQSDNVAVDYTLRKNVWKPKAAAAGAVHYSQQKTVYVNPSRRPDV